MRRLLWILRNVRGVWRWAGIYTSILKSNPKLDFDFPLSSYVEFEVPGMVAPYDRMRIVAGPRSACGQARMGMSLHVNVEEWGGWNGGVIDFKDLIKIRDLINIHLAEIEKLSPAERFRLQQTFSERLRLKREWTGNDAILGDDTITESR